MVSSGPESLLELSAAADEWAAQYRNMSDAYDFHCSLQFSEAVALADVLLAAGRADLAAALLTQWGHCDPEEREFRRDDYDAAMAKYQTRDEGTE